MPCHITSYLSVKITLTSCYNQFSKPSFFSVCTFRMYMYRVSFYHPVYVMPLYHHRPTNHLIYPFLYIFQLFHSIFVAFTTLTLIYTHTPALIYFSFDVHIHTHTYVHTHIHAIEKNIAKKCYVCRKTGRKSIIFQTVYLDTVYTN